MVFGFFCGIVAGQEFIGRIAAARNTFQLIGQKGVHVDHVVRVFHTHQNICRVACVDHILGAKPQRAGGGQNDEHHGGENADICKTDGVLLHAVQHAGNTDEVACFVIIIFIAAQKL